MWGGSGRDSITDRRGADYVYAGRGADRVLLIADGRQDRVNCGPNHHDVLFYVGALEADDIIKDCERVAPSSSRTASRPTVEGQPGTRSSWTGQGGDM